MRNWRRYPSSNWYEIDQKTRLCWLTAVPDPPVSVIVRCNNVNRTAEIWWQPGKENYAPILNFVVQYNTTFQPELWYVIGHISYKKKTGGPGKKIELLNLV